MPSNILYNKKNCLEWHSAPLINPISKRAIKKDGPIYKTFQKECAKLFKSSSKSSSPKSIKDNIKTRYTKDICSKWHSNPLINPISKKPIKKDGPTYKIFQKECSPNIKKSVDNTDDISLCKKWIKNRLINPKTNNAIKKDGPLYKQYLKKCSNLLKQSSKSSSSSRQSSSPKKFASAKSSSSRQSSSPEKFASANSSSSRQSSSPKKFASANSSSSRQSSSPEKFASAKSSSSRQSSSSGKFASAESSSSRQSSSPEKFASAESSSSRQSSSSGKFASANSSSSRQSSSPEKFASAKSSSSRQSSSPVKFASAESSSSVPNISKELFKKSLKESSSIKTGSSSTSFKSLSDVFYSIKSTSFSKYSTGVSLKSNIEKSSYDFFNPSQYLVSYEEFTSNRIEYYNILHKYISKINDKYENNCIKKYKIKDGRQLLRIGNRIILEKQLGNSGSYGIVYKCYYRFNKKDKYRNIPYFAVKICKIDDINTKEIKIAEKLTLYNVENNFYNFPLLYGYLKCNTGELNDVYTSETDSGSLKYSPESSFDSGYNSLLNNDKLYFQIYEMANGTADFYFVNIIDSKTDKIENNDLVFNALVQLFLSTISFQICTGMQHSDTHFGNFLYHKIKPGNTNISTTFYNFTINIKNMGYLWVINDFGLAESLNDKSNIKMNESYIVKIINDYKEILKELTRYNRFFKDETIPNFISEMMGYLNPELYSENKFNLLHINILNCFLKYTTTVSSSNIKQ
jgi:hypothetical protein